MQKIKDYFPFWEVKNIRLYYVLVILRSFWFIGGIWIFYWLKFMDFAKLGLYQSIAFSFALLIEIPVGALIDFIGRRKGQVISCLLSFLGCLIVGTSQSDIYILIGFMLMHAGWTFYSSSGDVLAYESLSFVKKKLAYDKVLAKACVLGNITSIFGTLLGGFMFMINPRIPYLAWSLTFFIAFILSLFFSPVGFSNNKFSLSNYLHQFKNGFLQLAKPGLREFILIILVLRGTAYLYGMGFLKSTIAMSFGFLESSQSIVFAIIGIFGTIAVSFFAKIRKRISDVKGLYILNLILGISYLIMTFNLSYLGILPMIVLEMCAALSFPWIIIIINRKVNSKYRATTLASSNLIIKIPYVLTSSAMGKMISKGELNNIKFIITAVAFLSTFISIWAYNKYQKENKYNLKFIMNNLAGKWRELALNRNYYKGSEKY